MLTIPCTLVLPVMSLSLGSAGFLVVSTADIVLGPISSLSGLVIGILSGMLCKHNWVLCVGPSILKES